MKVHQGLEAYVKKRNRHVPKHRNLNIIDCVVWGENSHSTRRTWLVNYGSDR